ncbi:hypothetical protein Y032_0071g593 [Ancylostoma ceylanicum]|uniref:Uncharacterized protein n=1 Tax=Ancylostoma ceylanicum TaxID=53326 RepID=A0A016TW90_9BILA|nr:hypothetical protein Y032_0071g593 [Ancylostoma ceylanicum]
MGDCHRKKDVWRDCEAYSNSNEERIEAGHECEAVPLALLGGDPSRQHSPDIEVSSLFFNKTRGWVAQNYGYYSQEFSEVRRCQTRNRPLLAQMSALREIDSA